MGRWARRWAGAQRRWNAIGLVPAAEHHRPALAHFLLAKSAVIMVVVLSALILVFVAGGVRAPATTWLARLALMWLALLPMTILGAPWKISTGTYAAYITDRQRGPTSKRRRSL